jgi:hypothetical protein
MKIYFNQDAGKTISLHFAEILYLFIGFSGTIFAGADNLFTDSRSAEFEKLKMSFTVVQ